VKLGDQLDLAVGLVFPRAEGEHIAAGEEVIELRHNGRGLDEALALLRRSFELVDAHTPRPLVLATY
jgi:thymidine phosphorylase